MKRRHKGYKGKPTALWKTRLYMGRETFPCFNCGKLLRKEEATVDHYVPKSKGGREAAINYNIACVKCNRKKGNRMPEDAHIFQFAVESRNVT